MKLSFFAKRNCLRPCALITFLFLLCSMISEIKTLGESADVELVDLGNPSFMVSDKVYHPKIKSISIKSKIRFRYARTVIISTLVNPDPKKSHEVNFKLRIPREAFISKFEMKVDGGPEIIKANVTSSEDADKEFEFAKSNNKTVTLGLIKQSSDTFDEVTMKFIIGANKNVLFLVVYEERVTKISEKYESVIHLMPELLSDKTVYRIEVNIEETERIKAISVPWSYGICECEHCNNSATIEKLSEQNVKVSWSNKLEHSDTFCDHQFKEFVVLYSLEDEVTSGHVLIRNGYFVHFFSPNNLQPLKKHVVFVLDVSDSMTGTKLAQLQSAMKEVLDSLVVPDFFNIISFSNDVEVWSYYRGDRNKYLFPFPAKEIYKESAEFFVKNLAPRGSTNIHSALTIALEVCKNVSFSEENLPQRYSSPYKYSDDVLSERLPPDVQSIIIFLTDGEATSGIVDKRAILTSIKKENYDLKIPIYSVAFGDSADFKFLNKISIRNNAFARKVYEKADANLQLADFYKEISSPILANLSFNYKLSETSPFSIANVTNLGYPMIFKGNEIIVVGKLQRKNPNETDTGNGTSLTAEISGIGRLGKKLYLSAIRDCTVSGTCQDETNSDDQFMEKLFVYLTIKNLLKEEASYIRGNLSCWTKKDNYEYWYEVDPVDKCSTELREKAVKLAIEFGFVTPYTSLVMRTKSIFEEETDIGVDPNAKNVEWEVFLGNVNPLPDTSKLVMSANSEIEDGKYIHQEAPEAQPLIGTTDSGVSHHGIYQKLDIPAVSQSTLMLNRSVTEPETFLTLNDIAWLPVGGTTVDDKSIFIRIPNNSGPGEFVLDRRPIIMPSKGIRPEFRESCSTSAVPNGTCKHLRRCIHAEYLDDYQLYLKSHWCPIRYGRESYLGACCGNTPDENLSMDIQGIHP